MNRKLILPGLFLLLAIAPARWANGSLLPGDSDANRDKNTTIASTAPVCDYARACQPVVKPAFVPLPIGDVEPAGWLRDWAEAAAKGITGHLDEYSPVFGDAWKGFKINAPNAAPDGTGWPLEQCSYWLDGAVRLGYILHDEALIKKATARLDLVVNGVNNGGTSLIYWTTNPPEGFNSWACSHMGRALVAYFEATGEKRILDALDKAYCNYQVPGNLDLTNVNVSGLCNLDAMLETYSFTGDTRLLEQATSAMDRPDVQAGINDWLAGKLNPCHTVCYYEIIRLPALFYPWSGEQKYLEASLKAFQWVDTEHMLPYGVASGGEFLSGIGPFRQTETCDVSASLWSRIWMYRITGERSWGDKLELEFFNAAAAPIARDFQTMCYYQSPNRIGSETLPIGHPLCPGPGCLRFTRLGATNVLCCVGNMNRIIPNYIMNMWMATYDGGLAATLYGPCTVHALAGDYVQVKLDCQTDYPFKDTIHVQVTPAKETSFPLYFRIPGWCHQPRLAVNGDVITSKPDEHGFVRIERTWKSGDTVTLKLPMSVRIDRGYADEYSAANREYYGYLPKAVFEKKRLPYESIYYGPLLFAMPIPDLNPNEPKPDAHWQFALNNNPKKAGRDIAVEQSAMPLHWDWPLEAPIVLKVSAKEFDWNPSMSQPLPNTPVKGDKRETISLVPYGCTKFRISMFPVTQKAWKNPPPASVAEAGQSWDK
jgi:uncharacterized protein